MPAYDTALTFCTEAQVEAVVISFFHAYANTAHEDRAREILAAMTDLDVSADAFAYLDGKRGKVAGVDALQLRADQRHRGLAGEGGAHALGEVRRVLARSHRLVG